MVSGSGNSTGSGDSTGRGSSTGSGNSTSSGGSCRNSDCGYINSGSILIICHIIIITVANLTSLNNVPLLTSVDVVPLMKTAEVVENSGHCMYSIGLKCL